MSSTRTSYRVIQCGTGQTGTYAIGHILDHPDLELVGLKVHSQQKVGLDAGDLAALEPTGVKAVDDLNAILALDADCVSYIATDIGRDLKEVVGDVCQFLECGKNVVCTQTTLGFLPALGDELATKVTEACRTGGTSFYATGLMPDGSQLLCATAASMGRRVDSVGIHEMYDASTYAEPTVYQALGLGLPAGHEPSPAIFEHLWRPWMMLVAHVFGAEIGDYRHAHKSSVASRTYDLPAGHIGKGTVCAIHHTLEGLVDGVCRVRADGTYWLGDQGCPEDWGRTFGLAGYRISVRGRPDMTVQFEFAGGEHEVMGGPMAAACEATAARAVNLIPAVCNAKPGLLTFLDLPMVLAQVAWRP